MVRHAYFIKIREHQSDPEVSLFPVLVAGIKFIANISAWLFYMGKKFADIFGQYVCHRIHLQCIDIT